MTAENTLLSMGNSGAVEFLSEQKPARTKHAGKPDDESYWPRLGVKTCDRRCSDFSTA